MTSSDVIERGSCTACGGPAERGPSGAWWHVETPCGTWPPPPATFEPADHRGEMPPGTIVARGREILALNWSGQWLAPGCLSPMQPPDRETWSVVRWGGP